MVGTRISLRGDGVTFTAPAARLRLFDGGLDLSKSMLVLAPHPDDAEIAAFGLYANRNASVVTVTAGQRRRADLRGGVRRSGGSLPLQGTHPRHRQHHRFRGRGRIPPERAFNMGYFDARLAEMHDKRDAVVPEMYRPNTDINVYRRENIGSLLPLRPRESKWGNLVDDMLALLKKVKPAVIVAPHPQLDTHRDHQFTDGRAVRSARAMEQAGHAAALHEPRRSQPLSVRPGRHADVAAAAARRRRRARSRLFASCAAGAAAAQAVRARVDARPAVSRRRASISWRERTRAPSHPRNPAPNRTSPTSAAGRARTSCSSSTTGTASCRSSELPEE